MDEQQPQEQPPEPVEEQVSSSSPLTKILIGIIAGLVVIFAIGVGVFFLVQKGDISLTGCTEEAKVCSDGTTVGRIPPLCEFAECPSVTAEEDLNIPADWETYRSKTYGFEFQYPPDFLSPQQATLLLSPNHDKLVYGIETIHLVRDVEYCAESGLPEHCTPYAIDTSAGFFIVNEDYDSMKERYTDIEALWIGDTYLNKERGFNAHAGVEGEGQYFSIFPTPDPARTLVAKRRYISKEQFGEYRDVEDFLSSKVQENIFNQILSTFNFIELQSSINTSLPSFNPFGEGGFLFPTSGDVLQAGKTYTLKWKLPEITRGWNITNIYLKGVNINNKVGLGLRPINVPLTNEGETTIYIREESFF